MSRTAADVRHVFGLAYRNGRRPGRPSRAALRRRTMLARRLVRRYSRSTPRATEWQLIPGSVRVDDRVLLHVRRLLGFLHVASANRGVCKLESVRVPFVRIC